MLFATHFDLTHGEGAANLTATVEDSEHRIYSCTVEWAGKVDGAEGVIAVVVSLSDDLTDVGDVMVRITHSGLTSDPMILGIGHLNGGPTP